MPEKASSNGTTARPAPRQIHRAPRPAANRVLTGDCIEIMRGWADGCIDHAIVDPPFNIGSGSGRKGKNGLGWAFSSHVTMDEAWDAFSKDEFFAFNVEWLRGLTRVVKPNGNILVFGTYHNIYQLGFILQNVLERRILNSVVWFKPNAQPNITARTLTESTEQIIWAVNETPQRATGWTFNYWDAKEMNGGKQMRNLWEFPVTARKERAAGKHPSQKPLALVERAVLLASQPGDLIVDPFGGAGTLGVAAAKHGRAWILIENVPEYAAIAERRLAEAAG
jgi:site-specific DNA-methyltransferase (adenine-specific)